MRQWPDSPRSPHEGKIIDAAEVMAKNLPEMIAGARILGLAHDKSLPANVRAIFRHADDESRPLTTKEFDEICQFSSIDSEPLRLLQENASQVVADVKRRLVAEDPGLIKPGGSLFPESRSEACWRDCWHFLRIAIYAVAADRQSFTHPPGVSGLRELYRELAVPIDSMAKALCYLREVSSIHYGSLGGSKDTWRLEMVIRHLEEMIREFSCQAGEVGAPVL
ncbi:phycobilisome polypeptide [Synechococcus sp. BSF8S]|uniref:phycobilisome polypeptide n=2 Tax=Cyanophyceae TaxID=3028117 RepID=UPI001623B184|nr:phycobilisome polypeptide [Synechococcus sp. BSF8S]MBC1262867.1 phycobilisome polypeptide [Synechococcus sp. BSA11S]